MKIKLCNAALIILGTSVGAGMLGLPVVTGAAGFLPSASLLLLIWAIMTATALMMIEVIDIAGDSSNFVSLSERLIGKGCKLLTFSLYVLLFLSLSFAYAKGGGVFIAGLFDALPVAVGVALFLATCIPFILLGPAFLGTLNVVLVFVLFGAFFTLISLGLGLTRSDLLHHFDWSKSVQSIPLFITSFGFHSVLPSLKGYIHDKKALRLAVLIGTTLTLFIYLIWEFFVLGIVPATTLATALIADQTAITPLGPLLESPLLNVCAHAFYFSALATSFLGVGMGLLDFFQDALTLKESVLSRAFLCLIIYIPAFWAAQTDLRVFYLSLEYGGGPACFYLLILLPILLFIRRKHLDQPR